METPAWELVYNERMKALAQIRDNNNFCMAVVTAEDGLTLIHAENASLHFPEYTCGPGSTAFETTATLLAVARFGEPEELKSYLKFCAHLRATRGDDEAVALDVQATYTPPSQ